MLDWALAHRTVTLTSLLIFALGSLALAPFIGQDFFPAVDAGQFRLHVRAPAGTRIEETERIFGQVEDVIREIVPAHERELILDNMGMSPSFTVRAYIDNGTVSDADGEILVSLKEEHGPTAAYVGRLRRELPRRFLDTGQQFFFQAGRILRAVDLELRLAPPRSTSRWWAPVRGGCNLAAGPRNCARSSPRFPASQTSTFTRLSTSQPCGWDVDPGSWRRSFQSWLTRSSSSTALPERLAGILLDAALDPDDRECAGGADAQG